MSKIPKINWDVEPVKRFYFQDDRLDVAVEDLGYVASLNEGIGICYYNAFYVYMGRPLIRNKITLRLIYAGTIRYHYRIGSILSAINTRMHLSRQMLINNGINVDYFMPHRTVNEEEAFDYAKTVLREAMALSKLKDKYGFPFLDLVNSTSYPMRIDDEQYVHIYQSTNHFVSNPNDTQPPRRL